MNNIHPPRFIAWLFGGMILGMLVTSLASIALPRKFISRAVISSEENVRGETNLSLTQARLIKRDLGSIRTEDSAQEISRNTTIRSIAEGVEIIVISEDELGVYDVTAEAARRFRSIAHERALTSNPVTVEPSVDADPDLIDDLEKIRGLLSEQSLENGFQGFLQVATEAAARRPEAVNLSENEDFSRRFARYKEISSKLGLDVVPGETFSPPLTLLTGPSLPVRLPSPALVILLHGGRIFSVILGIMLAFAFGRRSTATEAPVKMPEAPPSSTEGW